jgi:hypothetical protein
MKGLFALFTLTIAICLAILSIGCTFYGLYLAFSASIILGIIALVVEPSPFIFGIVMLAVHKNLPQMIMDVLSK